MEEEDPQPDDLWGVLEEAKQTVDAWPVWQQRVEVDIYGDRRGGLQPPEPSSR
ncbi:MAG TPA: hypothetical protein VN181_08465 [Thermoanaerobaculia bacterium]|nr:hypothetical protein [Thermoanaerobaculia bacterium]